MNQTSQSIRSVATLVDAFLAHACGRADAELSVALRATPTAFDISMSYSETTGQDQVFAIAASPIVDGVAMVTNEDGDIEWVRVDLMGNVLRDVPEMRFKYHPVFSAIKPVVIDGQHMIRIPRFFIRTIDLEIDGREAVAYFISDTELDGFRCHPAFAGGRQCFHVGAYQASLQGDLLASVPGVVPATNKSLLQFQQAAEARNTAGESGWMQWSALQLGAIRWLYLVEHCSMDCQSVTGRGRLGQGGAAEVDAQDVAEATYRGIVGLWGNVWQWLGGLKTVNGEIVVQDAGGRWISTGVKAATNGIYPASFARGFEGEESDIVSGLFVASESCDEPDGAATPNAQFFYGDGESFPLVGGFWSNAAGAGLWNVICSRSASYTSTYVGGRLAKG